MTVPAARTDPRLRRYPLRRLRLPVAGGTLSVVAPDAGAWLHTGGWSARAAVGDEPPYWADVWPAAIALARWLCRRRDLAGRSVLDLGCGIGLPGIAAARQGAEVTFADLHADALAFAVWNAEREKGGTARVHAAQHDWQQATLPGTFDVLCLADVTYRPVHHAPLLRHLDACLAPGGLAIHADPYRREADGFLSAARAAFASRLLAASVHVGEGRLPVRIWFFGRAEQALARWLAAAAPGRCDGSAAASATGGRS